MPSKYEEQEWRKLEARKARFVKVRFGRLIPERLRDGFESASTRTRQIADKAFDRVQLLDDLKEALGRAVEGLASFGAAGAAASLRTERIVDAHRSAGSGVKSLIDLQGLDLREIDHQVPHNRLQLVYLASGVGSGAAAGLTITAGEITVGSGAGAAPALPVVAGAIALDTVALMLAGMRYSLHLGAYYGYDPDDPVNQVRAAAILGAGMALSQSAKQRALNEVSVVTQLLYRAAPWEKLDQASLVKLLNRIITALGFKFTKKNLAILIPIVSVGAGAGLNAYTLRQVGEAADLAHRDLFLRSKGLGEDGDGSAFDNPPRGGPSPADNGAEDVVPIAEIVESFLDEASNDQERGTSM